MENFKVIVLLIFLCLSTTVSKAQKSQSVFKLNRELKLVEDLDSLLDFEVGEVRRLYERSVYFRVKIVEIAKNLNTDIEKPLGPQNVNAIKRNTNAFMALRDSLYEYTYKYENAMKISQSALKRQNITELERTKAVMLSTACALILYDNYLLGVVLLEQDDRVRRVANDPDVGFEVDPNQLLKVSKAANSIKNQERIIKGIEFLKRRERLFADVTDHEYLFLRDLIYSSPSKYYLKKTKQNGFFRKKLHLSQIFISDVMADFSNISLNNLSKFFGNTTGMVEMRKGKMYSNQELKAEIFAELEPLDILLEKTPFRLTDQFIPGYFGHAAIWIGKGHELDSIGVWDDKIIRKHQSDVSPLGDMKSHEGKNIIEALRDGVKLSSLDDFLNVDDFVILRPVFRDSLELKDRRESILLAFRQLGKEYDFNFDINTTEKIVCSELAYICYPWIDWRTEKLVGRHTISPDNIASLVWGSDQLKLISFYHNGVKCNDKEKEKLLMEVIFSEN